jgi:DNA-directed RNA polymerase specialized sigma24 family protein
MEPVTVRSHLFRARKAIRKRILESSPELVEGYGD